MRNTGVQKVLSNNCQLFAGRKSVTKWALDQSIRFTANPVPQAEHVKHFFSVHSFANTMRNFFDDARIYIFVTIYGVFPIFG